MKGAPVIYCKHAGKKLLAFGLDEKANLLTTNRLSELDDFMNQHQGDYLFGFLSYDLKNEIEDLSSEQENRFDFPHICFFVPKYVIALEDHSSHYLKGEPSVSSEVFLSTFLSRERKQNTPVALTSRISKEQYLKKVEQLKQHIQQGDIYEVTFCQDFFAHNCIIDPISTFWKLEQKTNAPFSSFVAFEDKFLLSGSPERFLKKEGNTLLSQPIKGTAKRGLSIEEDENIKHTLFHDPKERAENIMIVDLVRNDLSRIAEKASVEVEELCGVYSFNTVHQLISSIKANVSPSISFSKIINALFPMGSMTGAPKISAMKIIDQVESFRRGLFSGSVGFIEPNGDFDFNVVIRSILYDAANNYISCPVGGAITKASSPELEYEECLLKVQAMQQILRDE